VVFNILRFRLADLKHWRHGLCQGRPLDLSWHLSIGQTDETSLKQTLE